MQTRLWPWLCAVFLFFLIWEWMRPLSELAKVTQVYQVTPFLCAIACFIVVDALRVRVIPGLFVKLVICVMTVAYFFHRQMVWDHAWWQRFGTILWNDWQLLKGGQLLFISGEIRTILFLFGWAMILSAVFMVMVEKKRAAWFALLTAVYLMTLQLFWAVDVASGVARTLAIGFVLSAAGHYFRLHATYGSAAPNRGWPVWLKWGISSLLLLGVAFPLAFVMAEQYGEDPITGTALLLGETYSISGFSPGDTEVGGRVKLVDELIFTAVTPVPTYWRGESLHIYNGRGWETDDEWQDRLTIEQAMSSSEETSTAQAAEGMVRQVITFASQQGLDHSAGTIFAGGEVKQLHRRDKPLSYDVLISRDHVYRNKHMGPGGLENAWLNGEVVKYERLGSLPEDERLRYLQLPDELPDRIRDLAKSVVGRTADPIVQVERIEHFLRRTYTYTLDAPELDKGQDAVDVFLFEQMEGYCDHFSTSMVVMLRTLGIPARWVKGYAPGDLSSTYMTDQGERIYEYEVRQKHAHAWVEAYLPGIGWKMFEPTPADSLSDGLEEQQEHVQIAGKRSREASRQHTQMMAISQISQGIKRVANWFFEGSEYIRSKFGVISFVGTMFVGSGISGFIWWVRLQLAKRRTTDWLAWRWLFRKRGRPSKGQTLREYVLTRHARSRPEQKKLWLRRLHDFERKQYGPKN